MDSDGKPSGVGRRSGGGNELRGARGTRWVVGGPLDWSNGYGVVCTLTTTQQIVELGLVHFLCL